MRRKQRTQWMILCGVLTIAIAMRPAVSGAVSLVTNGDFSAAIPLHGWTTEPVSAMVSQAAGGFAVLGDATTDGTGRHSLVQDVTSAFPLETFSFVFAYATEASLSSTFPPNVFPDTFGVSITTAAGDFLDILLVGGVAPDTLGVDTDRLASPFPTATAVMFDDTVMIPGFAPGFAPGFLRSGRLTLDLRDARFTALIGVLLTLEFSVIDSAEGFRTVAAIDDVTLTTVVTTVPEPNTFFLLASGLAGLVVCSRRVLSSGSSQA